jgi:hypothetical protein
MRACPRASYADRRRRLWAWSRFPETPRQLVIEWTADGTDYLSRGTFLQEQFARRWHTLRAVFAAAPHKLTRQDVRRRWRSRQPPNHMTLKRWLKQTLEQGCCAGTARACATTPTATGYPNARSNGGRTPLPGASCPSSARWTLRKNSLPWRGCRTVGPACRAGPAGSARGTIAICSRLAFSKPTQ